jgi:hypothetical protein
MRAVAHLLGHSLVTFISFSLSTWFWPAAAAMIIYRRFRALHGLETGVRCGKFCVASHPKATFSTVPHHGRLMHWKSAPWDVQCRLWPCTILSQGRRKHTGMTRTLWIKWRNNARPTPLNGFWWNLLFRGYTKSREGEFNFGPCPFSILIYITFMTNIIFLINVSMYKTKSKTNHISSAL